MSEAGGPSKGGVDPAAPFRGRLVGRDDDLRAVLGAIHGPMRTAVIYGAAGVGKTRLAEEAATALAADGLVTTWAVASAEARSIAFAALAPLLPDMVDADVERPLDVARAVLARLGIEGHGPTLIVVDDAHLLDGPSSVLLQQLAATRRVSLLLTVRSGEKPVPAVESLWKDDKAARIDLGDLSEGETSEVLASALGGAVASAAVHHLWRTSGGNPLWLREVAMAAMQSGRLVRRGGRWSLRHSGSSSGPRLAELVGQRLETLDPLHRSGMEAIALGEPLSLPVAEALVPLADLAVMERDGLVTMDRTQSAPSVRLAHPVYGDAIRSELDPLHAVTVWRRLVAAGEAADGGVPDVRRQVLWRLEAGLPVEAELLVRAAERARACFDPHQAERFARLGLAQEAPGALVALLEALADLGCWEELATRMGALELDTLPAEQQCRVLLMLMWRGLLSGDTAGADARLVEIQALATDRDVRDVAQGLRSAVAFFGGDTTRAGQTAVELGSRAHLCPQARRLAHHGIASASAWGGRPHAAVTAAEAEMLRAGIDDTLAFAHYTLVWIYLYGLLGAGRLADAGRVAATYHASCLDLDDESMVANSLGQVGLHHLVVGELEPATERLQESLEGLRGRDPLNYMPQVACFLATARASSGDVRGARAALVTVEEAAVVHPLFDPLIERTHAWVAACAGQTQAAVERGVAAADLANQRGQGSHEAEALHDVVRMGDPDRVVTRLVAVAARDEGDLVGTYAAHAEALADPDATRLEEVASRFHRMGARLLAAETYAEASRTYADRGRGSSSRRCLRLSADMLGGRPAHTPALRAMAQLAALTSRELEVALLARDGLSNRSISERAGMSVRTVENHLHRVYSKLGVSGRGDLDAAINPPR